MLILLNQTKAAIIIQKWWRKKRKNLAKYKSIYLNKHIGRVTISEEQSDFQNTHTTSSFATDYKNKFKDNKRTNTPISTSTKRNIIIDLNKLGKRQMTFLESSTNMENSDVPRLNTFKSSTSEIIPDKTKSASSSKDDLIMNLFKEKRLDPGKLITISRMISNFNETLEGEPISKDLNYDFISVIIKEILKKKPKENLATIDAHKDDLYDDTDPSAFRLPILKPDNSILKYKDKYIVDLVKEKFVGFNAIKKQEAEGHKKIDEIKNSVLPRQHEFLTNDQRFFQKIYGNMSLGCLKAVDKAYEERNQIDRKISKQKKCENLKEFRKFSSQQVGYFKEDRIKEVQEAFKKEKHLQKRAKVKAEKEFEDLKDNVKDKREKLIEFKRKRRRDILIAIDFSKQHLSVSKALQRHEYLTGKENNLKKNIDFILEHKTQQENQHEIVKKYIEQRNALRLMQSNNERKIIRNRLKDDTDLEDNLAKARVDYLKSLGPRQLRPLKSYTFDFDPPGYEEEYFYENDYYILENNYDFNDIKYIENINNLNELNNINLNNISNLNELDNLNNINMTKLNTLSTVISGSETPIQTIDQSAITNYAQITYSENDSELKLN